MKANLKEWWHSNLVAAIVGVLGAILIAINHGDAILAGTVDAARVVKMALTVLVPYCVSTASSVGAMLEQQPANAGDAEVRQR